MNHPIRLTNTCPKCKGTRVVVKPLVLKCLHTGELLVGDKIERPCGWCINKSDSEWRDEFGVPAYVEGGGDA